MEEDIDSQILRCVEGDFKSVKQISSELSKPYVRVAVRVRQLRRRNELILLQSNEEHVRGVKPVKYKKRGNKNYI